MDGTAGEYTVSGDHVYLHPGSFTVGVSVTDPAGTTVSSTATATVASAPLTATGTFVDGTLPGSATTFTVATFTDPNGYDGASSYTATITWGDGQSGAGVVTGADGVFQVAGVHAYASDGTYTVGVMVSDADGTTATTTSQVTAGDLYAGVTQTLTVASFTDPNSYYTPSNFQATINWGDGTSMTGMVTKTGANYTVAGLHAYAAVGVYTMQVTVKDPMGNAITAYDVVHVAPASETFYAGAVDAGVYGNMPNSPLALFAVPQGYGSSGPYTATAAWGDGTTSAVTLQNFGGILEATGSHAYASLGLYAANVRLINPAGRWRAPPWRGCWMRPLRRAPLQAQPWCPVTRCTSTRSICPPR